jgi:hypothetical protein
MAEIELAALTKQYLDRRIGDQKAQARELRSCERERNRQRTTISFIVASGVASPKEPFGPDADTYDFAIPGAPVSGRKS